MVAAKKTPPLPENRFPEVVGNVYDGIRFVERAEQISQLPAVETETLPLCAYCLKPFTPRRRNQKFCNTKTERLKHFQRREALIGLVVDILTTWTTWTCDLRAVARRMLDAAYDQVFRAVVALGYAYHEKSKLWRLRKGAPQPARKVQDARPLSA